MKGGTPRLALADRVLLDGDGSGGCSGVEWRGEGVELGLSCGLSWGLV